MKTVLRLQTFEDRLVPAVAIDSAYETYAWVFINSLRADPGAFADNLDGLKTGNVNAAFGFTKTDAVIDDLKSMIANASQPAHYNQALALMRATAPAGPFGWHELLEDRAGVHNDWMKVNGFEHTGVNSGNRFAIPGFTRDNSAPADTWGYSGQFSWYGEDIGYAVGSLRETKDAYDAGDITLAGLQQRAAFLDTVAYMLELNSSSLGHLQNLLGRDHGTHPTLPLFNAIGLDSDQYEAPAGYEAQDGVPEAYLSTHRLGLYRPGGTGGFVAGIAYRDLNSNGYYDVGEGTPAVIDVRDSSGGGFTDTLNASHHGAFAGYVADGNYAVTITVDGVVVDSKNVTISDGNAWAEFNLTALGKPVVAAPVGSQASLRPTVSWSTVTGASGYQLRIDDRTADKTNIFSYPTATGTSWDPTADLVSGRSYRVWVRAVQGALVGAWSDFKDFSVAVPARIGPTGPASNIRPTLSWSDVTGATFQLRVDDVTGARNNIFPNASASASNWNLPADLVSGRTYRWRVRAVNAAGLGNWSAFTTFSVTRPTLIGPTSNVADLRPNFSWTAIAGATSYQIRVNDVTALRPGMFVASVAGTSWTPPADLVSGRSYSWQVRAVNALGLGAWTAAGRFGVSRPTLMSPIGDTADRTPTFIWSAINGATSYAIRITDLTTGKRIVDTTATDVNWTPSSDLVTGHRYRWVVRAVNDSGLGAWSVFSDFRVI